MDHCTTFPHHSFSCWNTYLAKFLLQFVTPSTAKNILSLIYFTLQKKFANSTHLHMASLDVDSLFKNITLDETIDDWTDNLYHGKENPCNIPNSDFCNLLNIATKESLFMFNNIYYRQVDGVSMGSPFRPALANIFMCSFEGKWLRDCPNDFKPVFYRRDVDEIFALFSSPDHVDKFKEYVI